MSVMKAPMYMSPQTCVRTPYKDRLCNIARRTFFFMMRRKAGGTLLSMPRWRALLALFSVEDKQ